MGISFVAAHRKINPKCVGGEKMSKTRFTISHFPCATKRKPCLPVSSSIPIPPAPLCPLYPSSSSSSSSRYLHPSTPPHPTTQPPSCGIMGIVQVAWRSTLCPRRSRRRRAVMTCSTARSPSSPSQLIPALRSSVAAAVGAMWVWAPSLELLVMCLAAAPILPLLPFRRRHCCCYRMCVLKMPSPVSFFSLPPEMTDTGFKSAPGLSLYLPPQSGLRGIAELYLSHSLREREALFVFF